MKNSNQRRGFVELSESSKEALVHGKQTLIVNALMDAEYQPYNAPWLVELDLPVKDLEPNSKSDLAVKPLKQNGGNPPPVLLTKTQKGRRGGSSR
jgi:hypothetical protein